MEERQRTVVDALGRTVALAKRPSRLVSLVPSLTELLFDLGAGDRVVARTDYCIHPAAELASLPSVGGQKDPALDALIALAPGLVVVAKEENLRRDVERLEEARIPVFVTDVRTIDDALALPETLGALCDADPAWSASLALAMRRGVDDARALASTRPRRRSFCAVWKDPWIGANHDTYLQSVLALCGVDDVCLDEPRRYPKVTLDAVLAERPEVILLPSEPYPFGAADVDVLRATLDPACAVRPDVRLIDGTLACWYGARMARLPELARSIAGT